MKRKETVLETNLIGLGYYLIHKTYIGNHSDKVDTYTYKKDNGVIEFYVDLDKTREKIVRYYFKNKEHISFTDGILESLLQINNKFHEELEEYYDFANQCVKEIDPDIKCEPFVEESAFDDNWKSWATYTL